MKNAVIGLFLGLTLLAPSFSYADTTPATLSDLDSLKAQLIQVLLQEVQILQAQLTALQAQANNTATDVAAIKANATVAATGGSVDNTAPANQSVNHDLVIANNDGSITSIPKYYDPSDSVGLDYDPSSGDFIYTGHIQASNPNIEVRTCSADGRDCSVSKTGAIVSTSVNGNLAVQHLSVPVPVGSGSQIQVHVRFLYNGMGLQTVSSAYFLFNSEGNFVKKVLPN